MVSGETPGHPTRLDMKHLVLGKQASARYRGLLLFGG